MYTQLMQDFTEAAQQGQPPKGTFFKTNKGDYAEHDQFANVPVPALRILAKKYADLSLEHIIDLLQSNINEQRLLALILLTQHYKKATPTEQEKIYTLYLTHKKQVNNWNLVDSSAHLIMGSHLLHKDKTILFELARSNNLWERRIAIVATWFFIRNNHYETTLKIATLLLNDSQDLIHKATGWMLRELGKRDLNLLIEFLDINAPIMPRTMLRYAIEKLPKDQYQFYLSKK